MNLELTRRGDLARLVINGRFHAAEVMALAPRLRKYLPRIRRVIVDARESADLDTPALQFLVSVRVTLPLEWTGSGVGAVRRIARRGGMETRLFEESTAAGEGAL